MFLAYLEKYPDGEFRSLADIRRRAADAPSGLASLSRPPEHSILDPHADAALGARVTRPSAHDARDRLAGASCRVWHYRTPGHSPYREAGSPGSRPGRTAAGARRAEAACRPACEHVAAD